MTLTKTSGRFEKKMMPHLPYPRRTYAPDPAVPAATEIPARVAAASRPEVDLQSQFEAILDAVWKAEADWRFNDRLDMAVKHRRDSTATR